MAALARRTTLERISLCMPDGSECIQCDLQLILGGRELAFISKQPVDGCGVNSAADSLCEALADQVSADFSLSPEGEGIPVLLSMSVWHHKGTALSQHELQGIEDLCGYVPASVSDALEPRLVFCEPNVWLKQASGEDLALHWGMAEGQIVRSRGQLTAPDDV